jgi:hypothetical protein
VKEELMNPGGEQDSADTPTVRPTKKSHKRFCPGNLFRDIVEKEETENQTEKGDTGMCRVGINRLVFGPSSLLQLGNI